MKKTIALFGGSFDPPHIGHIAIIEALKQLEYIDEVVVMPTYLNPFKQNFVADASLRLKWLKQIFQNDSKVTISDFEVKQQKKIPTIQSVEYLLKKYSKIYLVIGADNLASLNKWHQFEKLQNLVNFIVVSRDGIEIDKKFIQLYVDHPISSSQLRQKLNESQLPIECKDEILKIYGEKK